MAYIPQRGTQHLWVDTKECGDTTSCGILVNNCIRGNFHHEDNFTNFATCFHWQNFKLMAIFGMQALSTLTRLDGVGEKGVITVCLNFCKPPKGGKTTNSEQTH